MIVYFQYVCTRVLVIRHANNIFCAPNNTGEDKVKVHEWATKVQKGIRCIALLFL